MFHVFFLLILIILLEVGVKILILQMRKLIRREVEQIIQSWTGWGGGGNPGINIEVYVTVFDPVL